MYYFYLHPVRGERLVSDQRFVVVSSELTGLSAVQNCQLSLPLLSLSLSFSSLSHLTRSTLIVSPVPSPDTLSMSTSSSPNPPSALGECVVCGKESSTRCSSCATGGVDWMYFCSTEHQKLVSAISECS